MQEAHEALYEMEMAALEAQAVARATEAALDSDDEELTAQDAADEADAQQVSLPSTCQHIEGLVGLIASVIHVIFECLTATAGRSCTRYPPWKRASIPSIRKERVIRN